MKLLKTLGLFTFMLLLMVACKEKAERTAENEMETAEIPNADEAMKGWSDAWNSNDSQMLKDYSADDAVLLMWGRQMTGDSLNTWMDSTATWMKDLRTTALMTEKDDNFAWETGTYTHGTSRNDTLSMRGTYTVIWERAEGEYEGDWRIKVMDISPEQEPMQPQEQQ
ncbi:MAG: DUF4440 domain-containing protein [Salinimicrobium sediminis]|nr:DUF4440 domain-containing protein [Salinimicrobium sediminis]